MNSLVSVDWDFFIPHGMFEDVQVQGHTMPGMLVYDWQMSETRAPEFEMEIWKTRAYNFREWKLDIDKLTYPPLTPQDFALQVSARMGEDVMPMAWRADSHAWGAILCRDMAHSGPINVINFDAHHDLGYTDEDPLADFKATGRLSCDNWALVGLHEGWIKNYTIVYPDWLGRKEWMPTEIRIKPWRKQIKVTTWSKWLTYGKIPNAEMMFFCRSSSWTPPWLDQGFQTLTEEFGYSGCLDCDMKHNSPFDTCEMREWDWEAVEAEHDARKRMIAEVRKINKKILK